MHASATFHLWISSAPSANRLQRAVGEPVERPCHHQVERGLDLAEPPHAVGQARRAEAALPEAVAPASLAEHAGHRDVEPMDADLAVVMAAGHCLDVPDDLEPRIRQIHDACRRRRLGDLGIVFCPGDQDGKGCPARAGDEPLVPVDGPRVPGEHPPGLHEGGIRAGDVRLGHGEAGPQAPLAHGPQVGCLLLVGAEVQQRVHVSLVERYPPLSTSCSLGCQARLGGADFVIHERPHPLADLLHVTSKGEVDGHDAKSATPRLFPGRHQPCERSLVRWLAWRCGSSSWPTKPG